MLLAGCATETKPTTPTETPPAEEPKTPEQPAEKPVEEPATPQTVLWKADGIITQNEYKNSREFDNGRFSVYWYNDNEYLYMAIRGQTSGWVSIGFEPTYSMLDADMVFGWVSSGTPTILDVYSTGAFGPHPPDQQLGGTNDLIETAASEGNGVTIVEFKRKMNTGDRYDKAFAKGQSINIILGLGSSDSLESPHIRTGSGRINLD